jgi:hypothetical protein
VKIRVWRLVPHRERTVEGSTRCVRCGYHYSDRHTKPGFWARVWPENYRPTLDTWIFVIFGIIVAGPVLIALLLQLTG